MDDISLRRSPATRRIYVVPALGGAGRERKIAAFGYYPRWSPDGSQVLFQTRFTAFGYSNRFYVAQLDGGAPREVLAEFLAQNKLWVRSAVWHPNGHVLHRLRR
jgi:Tol biopolymer transport system component